VQLAVTTQDLYAVVAKEEVEKSEKKFLVKAAKKNGAES
jgi:hypothetical protein